MMKRISITFLLMLMPLCLSAQIGVTSHQEGWDRIPPQAQKSGFGLQLSAVAQLDDDPQLEEVMVFGHDNGHWPEFDLFKFYIAVVGVYDKQIKYISGEMVNDKYNLLVEDRNADGRDEIYISYIKEGSFSVDERGYNMKAVRCYDRIEFVQPVGDIL